MKKFDVQTESKEVFVDITGQVEGEVKRAGIKSGVCVVYVPHTTAAVTINENADPSVRQDIVMTLRKSVPDSLPYAHTEGNCPAPFLFSHLLSPGGRGSREGGEMSETQSDIL